MTTLQDLIKQNGHNKQADGIAVTATQLGIGYWALRSWIKGTRKPSKTAMALLKAKGITLE